MNRQDVEAKYKNQGLETEYGFDNPGKVYELHRHEKTYLYTLSGSLELKLDDNDWMELESDTEAIIDENQLHEAKVGPKGWEYVAAWEPDTND